MDDPSRNRSRGFAFAAGASGVDALEFLERSRDVASEVVVDGGGGGTSVVRGGKSAAPALIEPGAQIGKILLLAT